MYCCGLGDVTTSYVPLSAFASSADVAQLTYFMRRDAQRVSEGIALASALTVLPPEPGDRFAVTVSAAGFDSEVAGSVSVSYRPAPGVILFGGYARSQTQNLYKGGASFSFK
jgi:YadA-like C-terminal region.